MPSRFRTWKSPLLTEETSVRSLISFRPEVTTSTSWKGLLGEILIPAIKDVIVKIDVPGKKMIVRLIEGLLEEPVLSVPSGRRIAS